MYKRCSQGWLKHIDFMILDIICLHWAFILAFVFHYGFQNPYGSHMYRNMAIIMTLIDIIVMISFECLKNVLKRGYYKEFIMTIKHVCLVELLAIFYLFIIQVRGTHIRMIMILIGALYGFSTYAVRVIWKHCLLEKMSNGGKRALLIVTVDSMVDKIVENIKNHNYELFHLAGVAVINKDMSGQVVDGIQVVANADTVAEYACKEWVDEVFIDMPPDVSYPEKLTDQFTEMGLTVHTKLMKHSSLTGQGQKQFIERMGNYTVLTTSINTETGREVIAKRLIDIVGGTFGCIITGLLFLVLAPLIYLESPGPVFFSQIRVGKNGKKFKMYKFRSMYMDAEERKKELLEQNIVKDGMMFKMEWDPRIIGSRKLADGTVKKGIGNRIRDWSIDEFPQFFNVLKGDMSLVGTRPPTVDEWEKYELHHRARLAAKPGLTGIWQVSGRSNITDFEEVVKMDTKYITEWSMGLDLRILFKTVAVVFRKEGSM